MLIVCLPFLLNAFASVRAVRLTEWYVRVLSRFLKCAVAQRFAGLLVGCHTLLNYKHIAVMF